MSAPLRLSLLCSLVGKATGFGSLQYLNANNFLTNNPLTVSPLKGVEPHVGSEASPNANQLVVGTTRVGTVTGERCGSSSFRATAGPPPRGPMSGSRTCGRHL